MAARALTPDDLVEGLHRAIGLAGKAQRVATGVDKALDTTNTRMEELVTWAAGTKGVLDRISQDLRTRKAGQPYVDAAAIVRMLPGVVWGGDLMVERCTEEQEALEDLADYAQSAAAANAVARDDVSPTMTWLDAVKRQLESRVAAAAEIGRASNVGLQIRQFKAVEEGIDGLKAEAPKLYEFAWHTRGINSKEYASGSLLDVLSELEKALTHAAGVAAGLAENRRSSAED